MYHYIVAYYNIPNGSDNLKVLNLEDKHNIPAQVYYDEWKAAVASDHGKGLRARNNTWFYVTYAKNIYAALKEFWEVLRAY